MEVMTIEYPDEVRASLGRSDEQFVKEIRLTAAIKLYELRRLSSGQAAELAGIPRVQFLYELGHYGVDSFNMDDEELLQDVAHAQPFV